MTTAPTGLRLVVYCVRPQAYDVIAGWAARHGHKLLLIVTSPGPASRPTPTYHEILAKTPPKQDIFITTRMQRPVPLLRELAPDLVLSFTFPYRIPPGVVAIPKYGAVNLHPAPLPLYRGPNPLRLFYDGHPVVGSTLHWTAAEYDTGNILAKVEAPVPEDRSIEKLMGAWMSTMGPALEQGVARAVAGDPGEPQDEAQASYGGRFTAEERLLDWNLPAALFQARAGVLAFNTEGTDGPGCLVELGGRTYAVRRVERVPDITPPAAPGTLLERADGALTVCVADGVVRVAAAEVGG